MRLILHRFTVGNLEVDSNLFMKKQTFSDDAGFRETEMVSGSVDKTAIVWKRNGDQVKFYILPTAAF